MELILEFISTIDRSLVYFIQSVGPILKPVAWFLSNGLGYTIMLPLFVLGLFLIRRHRIAIELTLITCVTGGIVLVLKHIFQASRPYMIDPHVIAYATDSDFGLPSGHASLSMVILGWIALRHPKSTILTWGSPVLIVLIGLSRIYLGVHYPSQVIAGWLLGGLVIFIFYSINKRLWRPFQKSFER